MRPVLSRLKPPRPLRALQHAAISAAPAAAASTRRTVSTAAALRADEPLNERLRRHLWGANAPTNPPPQIPDAEAAAEAEPTPLQGYVPKHDGRGLRVVGIVGRLGRRVEQRTLQSFPTLKKVTEPHALEALLRRAVVETYTNVLYGKKADDGIVREGGGGDLTGKVEVVRGQDGGFRFLYESEAVVEGILSQGRAVGDAEGAGATIVEAAEAADATAADATVVNATAADATAADAATDATAADAAVDATTADATATDATAADSTAADSTAADSTAAVKATAVTDAAAAAEPAEEVVDSPPDVAEEIVPEDSTIAPLALSPTDAWRSLPLPIPHLFAIHKRLLLTTGHRLPDQALSHCPTALDLLISLREAAAPPPEKFDLLLLAPELNELGNVRVLSSRLRPVDREIAKGRLSPAQREWLENKRRRSRGEEVEGEWTYKWDEGKYFVL